MVNRSTERRPGFTLVELIVVMTILSILFALAAGAVFRAKTSADEAKVSVEIQQISAGIEAFKQKYHVSYMPSQLVLKNAMHAYDMTNPLERASKNYLLTMFPRITTQKTTDAIKFIGWTGDTNPTSSVYLRGPECLVFFLGGRVIKSASTAGALGFLNDPANPWPDPADANVNRRQGTTSFEFDNSRLMVSPFNAPLAANNPTIFVYLDPFASGQSDMPYFYFSSNKSGNDYSSFTAVPDVIADTDAINLPTNWTYGQFQIAPFMNSQDRFFNPNSFQLMSAGKNKKIGYIRRLSTSPHRLNCVIWENGEFNALTPPDNGTTREDQTTDNLCNFHGGKLGVPQ